MRKQLCLCLCALFLAGCSDSKNESKENTVKDTYLVSNAASEVENDLVIIRNREYENLVFSDFDVDFPEFGESISKLKLSRINSDSVDIEAFKSDIENQISFYFANESFDENDFYCNAVIPNETLEYYPTVDYCLERIVSGELTFNWFMYENEDVYAVWEKSDEPIPFRMSKGVAAQMSDADTVLASWLPSKSCTLTEIFFNDDENREITYPLLDGELSVGEAVDFFEKEYLGTLDINSDFTLDVAEIGVFEVAPDIYGYNFYFRTAFDGIPFDYIKNGTGHSEPSDGKDYSHCLSEAFMIQSNDIDTFMDLGVNKSYEITSEINEIISLQKAVQITSDELISEISFEVKRIDFLYTMYEDNSGNSYSVQPEWKLTTYCPNDGNLYIAYVNAETGKFHYQKQSSEDQY